MSLRGRRALVRGRRMMRPAGRRWGRLVDRFNALELREDTILLAFSVAIGIAGGLGVLLFFTLLDAAYRLFFDILAARLPGTEVPLYRPLLTGAGLALSAWLVRRLDPEARSGGVRPYQLVPALQLAVARRGGQVPLRTAAARLGASIVTLGSGGGGGSEGPVATVGATAASMLGRAFRFDPSRVRLMVGAGAAAGVSAAFNAPLAGAFFALESIVGTFALTAFAPIVIAAVVAALISQSVFGDSPALALPTEYGYQHVLEVVLLYPILGVLCGLAAALFVRVFFGIGELRERLRPPPLLLPWVGGVVVGTLVLLSDGHLVSFGHLAIRVEIFGQMAWWVLALFALGQILVTSITLNSGGSAGVFAPSLFVGAATGGAFGVAAAGLLPGLGLSPEPYALVGMAAVFAATTDAPLAAILIVFELTNDYEIMLPLMVATGIGYLVARRVEPDGLYSGWLRRRGEALEDGTDRDVMTSLQVGDVLDPNPQVIGEDATVAQLLEHLGRAGQTEYPVVDEQLRVIGVISIADLGRVAKEHRDLATLILASDLATPTETIAPDESILEAIRRMGVRGSGSLPVVEADRQTLVGMVSRGGILAAYERAVAEKEV